MSQVLCINCKWFRPESHFKDSKSANDFGKCTHPKSYHYPHTGEPGYAAVERKRIWGFLSLSKDVCNEPGFFFEPKP